MNMRVRTLMTSPVKTVGVSQSLPLAASIMELEKIRHLPVVDEEQRVVGLVTHRDILAAQISTLAPLSRDERGSLQLSIPVRSVMRTEVWTVASHALVATAARLLRDHRFGCLPVVDDGVLVGIITESDILELVASGTELVPAPPALKVENAMTLFPVTISPATSIADARALMSRWRVHHLPVVDGTRHLRLAEVIYGSHVEAPAQLAVGLVGKERAHEVSPEARLDAVLREMSTMGVGASMVVDGGRLIGVLTTTDVCRLFGAQLRAASPAA
jgi:CBS domain-containing membrane protein